MNNCENCGHKLANGAIYCANCGQKVHEKLGVRMLFDNTISNYFSIDSKLLKSIPYVLLRPGFLARSFIAGYRTKYMHPAKLFLFSSLVFFFLFAIASRDEEQKTEALLRASFDQSQNENTALDQLKTKSETDPLFNISFDDEDSTLVGKSVLDSLIYVNAPEDLILEAIGYEGGNGISKFMYRQLLNFYKRKGGGMVETVIKTMPWAMFLTLPLYAFILFLLFKRKEPYVHHLVLSFYQFTFIFTLMSILLLCSIIADLPIWLATAFLLFIIVYIIAGLNYFYRKKLTTILMRSAVLLFIFTSVLVPLTFILVIIISVAIY